MASRRIKRTGMRSSKAPMIACLIGMVITVILASVIVAYGGTHTYKVPLMYGVVDPDSVLVRMLEIGTGTQVGDDSIVAAFPDTLVYTGVDSQKIYEVQVFERWYSSGEYERPVTWTIPFRLVVASATISAGDAAEIADSTDAQLTATKGTGPWGASGGGVYTVDIFIGDTLGGTTTSVSGVTVDFRNWAIDYPAERTVSSNENGIARIGTDSDSLAILAVHNPFYVFPTSWDSITWSADYTDTILGYLNLPAAVAAPAYVVAYIDIMGSSVDSVTGQAIPRDKIYTYLDLVAEGGTVLSDGSQAYIPKRERKKPNSDGRVNYVVPANSALTPVGSYYVLSFEAWDGQTLTEGILKRFTLDTLVDPINILDATEAAP